MKKDFASIVGNDSLCRSLAAAIRAQKLSHAYILLGPRGSGKHTLAYSVAAALSCVGADAFIPCTECDSCRKILNRASADVSLIGIPSDKASIGVDEIREQIKNDIITYPNDGDHKFYIIEDAHKMTQAAQNALLLTLEEPPAYAFFFLLCENLESILETIKSRAPVLRMGRPDDDLIIEYLRQSSSAAKSFIDNYPDDFAQLLRSANGNIGYIKELISGRGKEKILKNRRLAESVISSLADGMLARRFSELIAEFSSKREELLLQLDQISLAARDLILLKKSDSMTPVFFTDQSLADDLALSLSINRIMLLSEQTDIAKDSIAKNANVRLTLLNYLTSLL